MKQDLIALAEQFPSITVSVQLSDLLAAGRTLKEEILEELRANQEDRPLPASEQLLSREETMEKFRISSATIWRWKKCGYLVPIKVGSMDRYRLSDINNLLAKKGGAL
jgi:predicted DNA-binding transcriptional regulator AlpA